MHFDLKGISLMPLNVSNSTTVMLEYSVYFPKNFDFVKGGKLPGLYGGPANCTGGNAVLDCFSARYSKIKLVDIF